MSEKICPQPENARFESGSEKSERLTSLIDDALKDDPYEIRNRAHALLETKDFYETEVIEGTSISLHRLLFMGLPRYKQDYPHGFPENKRQLAETIRLMEEVNPVPLEKFLEGLEIVTETIGKIELNDQVDIELWVRRINQNEIWGQEGRVYFGSEKTYEGKIRLFDKEGNLIHDFDSDLPANSKMFICGKMTADKDAVYVNTRYLAKPELRRKGIMAIVHEIGHNQQMNEPAYRERFYKEYGFYPEEAPHGSNDDMERDAWARALRILRGIEKKNKIKIFPEEKEDKEISARTAASDFIRQKLSTQSDTVIYSRKRRIEKK